VGFSQRVRWLIATIESRPCTHTDPCVHPHKVTVHRLPDGTETQLQPGDIYVEPWSLRRMATEGTHHCAWDDCDGGHLIVILPTRYQHPWNIDGRASNCTQTADRRHRCWVRRGDPAAGTIHVSKGTGKMPETCSAGGGSIQADGWHGYLHNGILRE
jgi:hypothetical protein